MNKREIKFRAWDGKLMRYLEHGEFILEYTGISEFSEYGDGARRHRDWSLMQFTGLKDKNGRDIYEGDWLRKYSEENGSLLVWGVVVFNSCAAFVIRRGLDFMIADPELLEVIGNIYENPELLKP